MGGGGPRAMRTKTKVIKIFLELTQKNSWVSFETSVIYLKGIEGGEGKFRKIDNSMQNSWMLSRYITSKKFHLILSIFILSFIRFNFIFFCKLFTYIFTSLQYSARFTMHMCKKVQIQIVQKTCCRFCLAAKQSMILTDMQ